MFNVICFGVRACVRVCVCLCEYDSRSHDLLETLQNNTKRPPEHGQKKNSLIYTFSCYTYYIIWFRDTVVIVGLMIVTRHYPRVGASPMLLRRDTRQRNRYYYYFRRSLILYTFLLRFNLWISTLWPPRLIYIFTSEHPSSG